MQSLISRIAIAALPACQDMQSSLSDDQCKRAAAAAYVTAVELYRLLATQQIAPTTLLRADAWVRGRGADELAELCALGAAEREAEKAYADGYLLDPDAVRSAAAAALGEQRGE